MRRIRRSVRVAVMPRQSRSADGTVAVSPEMGAGTVTQQFGAGSNHLRNMEDDGVIQLRGSAYKIQL